MVLVVPSRSRRANSSSGIFYFLLLRLDALKEVSHAWLDERPGSLILRLFLSPHDVCILVSIYV